MFRPRVNQLRREQNIRRRTQDQDQPRDTRPQLHTRSGIYHHHQDHLRPANPAEAPLADTIFRELLQATSSQNLAERRLAWTLLGDLLDVIKFGETWGVAKLIKELHDDVGLLDDRDAAFITDMRQAVNVRQHLPTVRQLKWIIDIAWRVHRYWQQQRARRDRDR